MRWWVSWGRRRLIRVMGEIIEGLSIYNKDVVIEYI